MKIILAITGSVAATLTGKLAAALHQAGHEVRIVATTPALYFLDPESRASNGTMSVKLEDGSHASFTLYNDKDEWPFGGYHKEDRIGHIDMRTWGDLLMVAPLSANTLTKLSLGLADNFVTSIARAWPKHKPLVLVPAMNTEMWLDPITAEQLTTLQKRFLATTVVEPIAKVLACGDEGLGAMANIIDIVDIVGLVNLQDSQ